MHPKSVPVGRNAAHTVLIIRMAKRHYSHNPYKEIAAGFNGMSRIKEYCASL
jgi:hypothetical protein